uniref:Elongation factor EFG domain-containing protein n=1 Tax=Parascaris equorum TaxID=6256 RepID=A0A914S8G7_PAREQ
MVKLMMLIPNEHIGVVNALCAAARGRRGETQSIDTSRLSLTWRMPLAEIVVDFFERLKRITSGYASFEYEFDGYDEVELLKMNVSINEETEDGKYRSKNKPW